MIDVAKWNRFIDGKARVVTNTDRVLVKYAFPLLEAIAALYRIRVPVPWDIQSYEKYVRYWRSYFLWRIAQRVAGRPLKPPLGPFPWYLYPPKYAVFIKGKQIRYWNTPEEIGYRDGYNQRGT